MAQKPNKEPFRYRFSVGEYLRALLELDGTGSTLGSYDVTIKAMPNKILKFTVKNKTGWESGTRLPFVPYDTSSIEDFLRGESKKLSQSGAEDKISCYAFAKIHPER